MSITLDSTSYNSGAIEVGGVQRIILGADGGAELHQSPTQDSSPLHIATMEALWAYGGMPRFTPYVWGGRADAMPAGDTQSSGQQLLDLMYPDMRADVVATQFTCPENEWQADPYKRLTHWSLGDGVSWMRPPDKNCVQPGSLEGPFFAGGVGSGSPLLGTVVLDQMQGFKVKVPFGPSASDTPTSAGGPHAVVSSGITPDATIASDGVNGTPRFGKFTRPRTWHGIWMIRMYGRVLNTGTLDAAGLNVRMDMLDVRVSALESGSSSLTKNGHKIHADGLIEQWGVLEGVALNSTFYTVTFPITFTQEVFNISGTIAMTGIVDGAISALVKKGGVTLATMQICGDHVSGTGTGDIYWKAKGK